MRLCRCRQLEDCKDKARIAKIKHSHESPLTYADVSAAECCRYAYAGVSTYAGVSAALCCRHACPLTYAGVSAALCAAVDGGVTKDFSKEDLVKYPGELVLYQSKIQVIGCDFDECSKCEYVMKPRP